MGYTHILTIHEDGIRNAKTSAGFDPEYVQSVGLGVLKLCLEPAFGEGAEGRFRVTWCDIKNMGSCPNWVADVHHTEDHIFLWAGNGLRGLPDLTTDELRKALAEISRMLESKQAGHPTDRQ
jgi:hypothetical protein